MIVKVCGMRDPDNIRQVDALPSVDWMGFIFWQKSKRYVCEPPKDMPINKKRVGVFVDGMPQNIVTRVYHPTIANNSVNGK